MPAEPARIAPCSVRRFTLCSGPAARPEAARTIAGERPGGSICLAPARGEAASAAAQRRAELARAVGERHEARPRRPRARGRRRAPASRRRSAGSAAALVFFASSKLATGPGWKKKPNMPPTAAVVSSTPGRGRALGEARQRARAPSRRAPRRRRGCASRRERREPGRDGERVARERARLVDRAPRRDLAHQLAAAAVRRGREPAAHHLAEAGQVGADRRRAPARRPTRRGSPSSPRRRSSSAPCAIAELAQPLEEAAARAARSPCCRPPARR